MLPVISIFICSFRNAIRRDPSIKGISISQNEIKLSQYADDTTLILDGSQDTFEASLDIIDKFRKISGLRLKVPLRSIGSLWFWYLYNI